MDNALLIACVAGGALLAAAADPDGPARGGSARPDADAPLRLTRVTVCDPAPWPHWNWAAFDQDKLVSLGRYQYALYWSADKVLVLVRRDLRDNGVATVRLEKLKLASNDGHRNTVLGVSRADGRLHLSWDHHCNRLRYARSRAGLLTDPPETLRADDIGAAEAMVGGGAEARVTYPRFVADRAGALYFLYRNGGSGSGDTYLNRYDAEAGTWRRVGRLFSRAGRYAPWRGSSSRNAYLHDVLFDDDGRLHVSWVYREVAGTWASNHDLHYAVSGDGGRTWRNGAGKRIADLPAGDPITVDDPGIVAREVPVFSWMINQGAMALDADGRPHVMTYRLPEPRRPKRLGHGPPKEIRRDLRYVHWWRDAGGAWRGGGPIDPGPAGVRRPACAIGARGDLYAWVGTPKGYWCLHARPADDYARWSVRRLTGPELAGADAAKHDRRLWREKGVLSIPAWRVTRDGRKFAICDFEASRPAKKPPDSPRKE